MLLFIRILKTFENEQQMFQYISCCYLSGHRGYFKTQKNAVSIHLMLLFIFLRVRHICPVIEVSIHLMLLFILFEQKRFYSAENVSIHLMLLFIIDSMALIKCPEWFQYISCCYLSERCREKWGFAKVSIHLMLLFIGRPSKAYKRLY